MSRKIILGFALALGLLALTRWSPARAQSAAFPEVSGVWSGTLPGGVELELRLTQDGQDLSGFGSYLPAGAVEGVDFDIQGEETTGGLALLNTRGRSLDTGQQSVLAVELSFAGDQAQARVVDGQAQSTTDLSLTRVLPGDPPGAEAQAAQTQDAQTQAGSLGRVGPQLRLWNHDLTPFQKYNPPEVYKMDFDLFYNDNFGHHVVLDVKLAGSLLTEVVGSWAPDPNVAQALGDVGRGRVACWNRFSKGAVSRVVIKTPDTLTVLGHANWTRRSSGRPGDTYTPTYSSSYTANGTYQYDFNGELGVRPGVVKVTLVSP